MSLGRLLVIAAILAGCAHPISTPGPGQGGMGLPQQLEGEHYPGIRQPVRGELLVAQNGCVHHAIDGTEMLVVWPRGSSLSDPVRLPDGTELADGTAVEGVGTIIPADRLPGDANGYWAHVTGFCTGDQPMVVVLDEVSEVR